MNSKSVKKSAISVALGLLIGAVNGFFGAGGGMIAVPLLKKMGLEQKSAHANAVAVILPITVISAFFYILNGRVELKDSLIFLPTGLIGAVLGTFCLKKLSPKWLKGIFALFMVYAGVRLLFK